MSRRLFIVFIQIRTVIGYGSPREGSEATHGAPLGPADLKFSKVNFGFNPDDVSSLSSILSPVNFPSVV